MDGYHFELQSVQLRCASWHYIPASKKLPTGITMRFIQDLDITVHIVPSVAGLVLVFAFLVLGAPASSLDNGGRFCVAG
jgi:hypothetical protein